MFMHILNQYSNYHRTSLTNVESIQDAQIIFLAEKHQKKGHQSKNALLIQQLYRQGDLVLVEHDCTASIDHDFSQIRLIPKKIEAKGWDLPINSFTKDTWELTLETKQLVNQGFWSSDWEGLVQKLKNYINDKRPTLTEEDINRYAQIVIDDKENATKSSKEKEEIVNRIKLAFSQENIDKLNSMNTENCSIETRREITRCLLEFVCKIFVIFSCREIDEQAVNRNLSMIQNIEANLKDPKKRIFVISGVGHLDFLRDATEKQIEGVERLRTYLQDKKFVILDPKGVKIPRWRLNTSLAFENLKEKIYGLSCSMCSLPFVA